MAAKSKPTWIAVMDGALARFYALRRGEDGQVFEETAPSLSFKKPARGGKQGRGLASAGGGRHAKGSDAKKLDTAQFSREIAAALDAAMADKRYGQLVLVAPPRNLSELRGHLTARVRETLVHQVPKDFTKLNTDALWRKLSVILLKAARPVNGSASRVSTVSGNAMPVSVVFRDMEASHTVQSQALKLAAKLGRKYGRVLNCRVTVEAPRHAHRKAKLFRVGVDLKLPGHEIATKLGDGPAYDDVNTALREAFSTAMRQLQDHTHRVKGEVLRTRRQSSPRTRGEAQV